MSQRETPTVSAWSEKARLPRGWLSPIAYFVGALLFSFLFTAIGAAIDHANRGNYFGLVGIVAMWTGAVIVLGTQLVAAMAGAIGPGPAWIRLPASLGCALAMPLIALTGFAMTVSSIFTTNVRWILLLTPLMFFAAQLPFWVAVYLRGWTLVEKRDVGGVERILPKVGVRGIMTATAVVAAILCCAQLEWKLPPTNSLNVHPVAPILSAVMYFALGCLIAAPLAWALLPVRITKRRIKFVLAVAGGIYGIDTLIVCLLAIEREGTSRAGAPWILLETFLVLITPLAAVQLMYLLGVLAFRAAGFRMVGKADLRTSATTVQAPNVNK